MCAESFVWRAVPGRFRGGGWGVGVGEWGLGERGVGAAVGSAWDTGEIETARVDQWLWSVRMTKTRSDAAAACRGGHVKVNGKTAKPATPVKVGDRVEAYLHDRERILEVVTLIVKRVGATVAVDCFVDHSPPPPEREVDVPVFQRERGSGRPTKRDKRQLDRLRGRSR
jgi:ribosome-associated heat shock protein Hsp15